MRLARWLALATVLVAFVATRTGADAGEQPRTLAPSPPPAADVAITILETVGVSDTPVVAPIPTVSITITETVAVDDGDDPPPPPVQIVIAEAVSVSDGFSLGGNAPIQILISESVGISDGSEVVPPLVVNISEAVGVSDGSDVAPLALVQIVISESVGVSDGSEVVPPLTIDISEAVGVSDGGDVAPLALVQIVISESIGVSDGSEVVPPLIINISEAVGISDGSDVAPLAPVQIVISESVAVSDGPALTLGEDGDGIAAGIDGEIVSGLFVDQSAIPSGRFTDQHLGGETQGELLDRADLAVLVTDLAGADGVTVAATDGAGSARIEVCAPDSYEISLTSGNAIELTCGSLAATVLAGPVSIVLPDDTLLTAPANAEVLIEALDDGASTIENRSTDVTVELTAGGETVALAPGDATSTADQDGDGVPALIDQCPSVAGDPVTAGCAFAEEVSVQLIVVDRGRTGACPNGARVCVLPLEGADVHIFDRDDADFVEAHGRRVRSRDLDDIFEAGVGLVGTCETTATGSCVAGLDSAGRHLLIVRAGQPDGGQLFRYRFRSASDYLEGGDGLVKSHFWFVTYAR